MSKITAQDLEFMEEAIRLSDSSAKKRRPVGGPFGAVVVKNGKIIGRGFNRVLGDNDPTAHGEIMAIRDACKNLSTYDLSDCALYTSCRPCPMCLAATQWANIKKVFYAAESRDAAKLGFRDSVMYKSFKKPDAGTKIKACAAHAARAMHDWHKKFWKEIY
jgi:tRNA(Arg) A34 adenosine deaminase TadA